MELQPRPMRNSPPFAFLSLLLLASCSGNDAKDSGSVDAGSDAAMLDAAGSDAAMLDGGSDATGPMDGGSDATPLDGGPVGPVTDTFCGPQVIVNDCPASHPKMVFGLACGEGDRRAVNALIGISWGTDGKGAPEKGGVVLGAAAGSMCGGYHTCARTNPTIPSSGATDSALPRSWSKCVKPKIDTVWVETYPKGPDGVTSWDRFGESMYNTRLTFDSDDIALVDSRLPVRYDLGGNTGFVRGNVTCNGVPVTPTVARAWANSSGSACGIQGFQATGNFSPGRYTLRWIAGGQCGAASQFYQIRVTAPCQGSSMVKTSFVDVARAWQDSVGAWHGTTLDMALP